MREKYYEAVASRGGYVFKIYHYDATGNIEIPDHIGGKVYDTKEEAEDAANEFANDMGWDIELG